MLFIFSTFYGFHFGNFLFGLRRWTEDDGALHEHDALDWLNMLTESGRITRTTCNLYLTASIALTSVVFFAEINVTHVELFNTVGCGKTESLGGKAGGPSVGACSSVLGIVLWSMQHIDMKLTLYRDAGSRTCSKSIRDEGTTRRQTLSFN